MQLKNLVPKVATLDRFRCTQSVKYSCMDIQSCKHCKKKPTSFAVSDTSDKRPDVYQSTPCGNNNHTLNGGKERKGEGGKYQ